MPKFTNALFAAFLMSFPALPAADRTELETLRSQAAGGDLKAQLDLALCYRDGKGVAKDDAEAMAWAHRAADGGLADGRSPGSWKVRRVGLRWAMPTASMMSFCLETSGSLTRAGVMRL